MRNEVIWKINLILFFMILSISFVTEVDPHLFIAFVGLFVVVAIRKEIRVDLGDLFLFLGMFIWWYTMSFGEIYGDAPGYDIHDAIVLAVGLTAVYQLGKSIVFITSGPPENAAVKALFYVAGFMLVKGLLNFAVRPKGESIEWEDWNGVLRARTQHEIFFVITACLLVYFVVLLYYKKWSWGIAGIVISILCVLRGVSVRGRLSFGCCICTLLIVLAGITIEKRLYKRLIFKLMLLLVVVAVGFGVIAYNLDYYGIKTWYSGSIWGAEGGFFHNVRFQLMVETLKRLKDYPFGNNEDMIILPNGAEHMYAHNSWLDVAKTGGIIPFVLIVAFTVTNIISLIRVWKISNNINKYAVFAGFIGFTLYLSVQPSIISSLLYWSVEVYMAGLLRGMYDGVAEPKGIRKRKSYRINLSL